MLQWAREHACPWDSDTCHAAAFHGHVEVLRWAWTHGCPVGWVHVGYCAAQGGHLEVLQVARELGCEWNENTSYCDAAVGRGARLPVEQGAVCDCFRWEPRDASMGAGATIRGQLPHGKIAPYTGATTSVGMLERSTGRAPGSTTWAREHACPRRITH